MRIWKIFLAAPLDWGAPCEGSSLQIGWNRGNPEKPHRIFKGPAGAPSLHRHTE